MPSFLNALAGKAQEAINASPLGAHLHSQQQQQQQPTDGSSHAPTAGDHTTGGGGGGSSQGGLLKQHGLGNLQNSLRALQVQYSKQDDKQIQLVITAQKSVALDLDSAGRDAKTFSKEFYIWGQEQAEDIKDVSDRLAYLNFVHGTLTADLSAKIDNSRAPYKAARNAEASLHPRRLQRTQIESQMARIKEEGETPKNGGAKRLAELEGQRAQILREDEPQEKEADVHKRAALKEGEGAKWVAVREYAEKLLLLAQASEALVAEIPANGAKYTGQARTAAIRTTLQQSLDNYKSGSISLTSSPFSKDAKSTLTPHSGSSTASLAPSFGQTHQAELSRTPSVLDKQKQDQAALAQHHASPSPGPAPVAATRPATGSPHLSTGVDTSALNNTPAPIPTSPAHAISPTAVPIPTSAVLSPGATSTSPPSSFSPTPGTTAPLNVAAKHSAEAAHHSSSATPPVQGEGTPGGPTVAETGVPLQAGRTGPGPSSGSLSRGPEVKEGDRPTGALEGQHSQGWSGPGVGGVGGFKEPTSTNASAPSPPSGPAPGAGVGGFRGDHHETAEDEKRRLEREERERVLRFGGGAPSASGGSHPPAAAGASTGVYPTAEEEKKRIEREERERILAAGRGSGPTEEEQVAQKGVPPPYDDSFTG